MAKDIKALSEMMDEKLALIDSLQKERDSAVSAIDEAKAKSKQLEEQIVAENKKRDDEITQLKTALEASQKELGALKAELDACRAKLTLTPVEDGKGAASAPKESAAAPEPVPVVSHRKVVEGLRGIERMRYYAAHRAEIDAEYK